MWPNIRQIYRVITFCPIVNCYGGGKNIKVLGWIETLLEEQDIYSEAWCLFKGCRQSPYCKIKTNNNKELHQYREQQRKRNGSDGAHGNQTQKRTTSTRNQNKWKVKQNLDVICPTCGKKREGRSCYIEIGACFSYEK